MTNHYTDVCEATIESLRQTVERQAAQIEMMREAARFVLAFYEPDCILDTEAWKRAEAGLRAALATTADLDGLVVCEKEPVAYMALYKDQVMGFMPTHEFGTVPVYRALEPKGEV